MNILYSGDENIERGVIISVLSLLKNIKENLHIFLITAKIKTPKKTFFPVNDDFIIFINNLVKNKNNNNYVKKIDISTLILKHLPLANLNTVFTPGAMFRLYADKIKQIPNKVLYLDNDIICRKNLFKFYHQSLNQIDLVGVLDHYGKWFFHHKYKVFDCINSGVLLLNLKKIRNDKLFVRCRKMCKNKWMFLADQTALNKLCQNKRIAPRKYNEQHKLKNETVLQHFTTRLSFLPIFHTVTIKPWQINQMHSRLNLYEYDDLLEKYQNIIRNLGLQITN